MQGKPPYCFSFDDVLDEDKQLFGSETKQPEKKSEKVRVCRPSSLLAAS